MTIKYILILVSVLILVSCGTTKLTQNQTDFIRIIADYPDERDLSNGNLKIKNLFKKQALISLNQNIEKEEKVRRLIDSVFTPNKLFWTGYLGDQEKFTEWSIENIIDNKEKLLQKLPVTISANYDSLFAQTTSNLFNLTGYVPTGNWYLVFGPAWTDLGGLGDQNMLIDFYNNQTDAKQIDFVLPHELCHQIFDVKHSNDPMKKTALYRCINEGFATYMNFIYHENTSKAKNLMYSQSEYEWCTQNEKKLFQKATTIFNSQERDDIDLIANRGKHLTDGSPGAAGYFIGLRICESYITKYGKQSIKDIFDLPVSELLEKSGYNP